MPAQRLVIIKLLMHTDQTLSGIPNCGEPFPHPHPQLFFFFQNSIEGLAAVTSSEAIPLSHPSGFQPSQPCLTRT